MDKIFSITCATCQARLAVRSEAAIGAILECPRCQSMVQVLPPPGWNPTPPSSEAVTTPTAGPPPLDHVAAAGLSVELEPAEVSLMDRLLRPGWLLAGGATLAVLAVALGLWLLMGQSQPESVALEDHRPATTDARTPASQDANGRDAAKADPVVSKAEGSTATAAGQQSGRPADFAAPESGGKKSAATPEQPPNAATQSPRTADGKPSEPDPFAAIAPEKEDPEQVDIKKAPPAPVDVAARLADPMAQLELTDVPLDKALELLAAIGALPVTIDLDALAQLGVAPRVPISLRLDATAVGKALEAVASQTGLMMAVENDQVYITTPAEYRETLKKVRYTVSDLTGDDKAAVAEFAALVRKLVAPDSWQPSGGRGTIEPGEGALIVVQSGAVHAQVLVFCEKLRTARHKPLRSREEPQRFSLATRSEQARKLLDGPVAANFREAAPLGKILAFLGDAAGADILVDHAALAVAETSDRVETSLAANKQPLGTTLTEMLRPLGLTFRTVGGRAIEVTTQEAAAERLELEFYPVGRWLADGISGEALAERLKARVAASTWGDVGGTAEVCFDAPSQCLIVLQSQPAQRAIERLLETKREGERRKVE